ncbi:MAG TPA: DUF2804 domain-containing protein [Lachnospiraceae bacterium]|nr:DUF2804 domain-containing protein [Lachnospiraceae bacterium]
MPRENHEVTQKQKLLDEKGAIAECGWSRKQLQVYSREDVKAPKFRIKEWDYYLVLGQGFGVAMTISDGGYIGLQSVTLFNFDENWEHTETILGAIPLGKHHLPTSSSKGDTRYEDKRLKLSFYIRKRKKVITRILDCSFENFYQEKPLSFHIELLQLPRESMVIATPWSEKKTAFYYNQKINCMRADGYAVLDGKRYTFHPQTDFGTLDWGRGVWTYDNTWYWGNGNCTVNGHCIGFNLGYGFGDTSAATENVIIYDGKVHKLEDVIFQIPKDQDGQNDYMKPWKITSSDGRFEMDFVPVFDRAAKINLCVILTDQHQVFGKMSGKMILDNGTVVYIKDCFCFAEKVHNRY